MNIVVKLYKISEKLKKVFLSIWLSYTAGISVDSLSESVVLSDYLHDMLDLSKFSVFVVWFGALIVILVWVFNFLFDKIRISRKTEVQFKKLMKDHTFDVLNKSEIGSYSWGYDKTLCAPNNPNGWKPEDIYIDLQNSEIDADYSFNESKTQLVSYDDISYDKYCKTSEKIRIIKQRDDDKERYAAKHIEKSMKGNKVEIRLQKTRWSQLQFSWDYLRRLDNYNEIIHNSEDEEINNIFVDTLNHNNDLLINSFCLHLILVSNEGKVILSRISKIKSNDYPLTWAATIGEQIDRSDFLNDSNGEGYDNFVIRWVKRALNEELGIDENSQTEKGVSELEEYADMKSLRVLSVDFEGDIYNIALTCLLKLNIDSQKLKSIKALKIDSNENTTEFKECTEKDVREILLNYPSNKEEYHPSTYLRLLMFHLYSFKQSATMSALVKDSKKRRFRKH